MTNPPSDAIVFFGATGDLAHKQIFPALLGLVRDEGLNVPIIGMGRAKWSLDQFKARAADSVAQHGPRQRGDAHADATQRLLNLLHYVAGRLQRRRHVQSVAEGTRRCQAAAALSRGAAEHVRDGGKRACQPRVAPRMRAW